MSRWFKMPVNTASNPAFALIAKRLNQPRALVICAYSYACEVASEAPETDLLSENALEEAAFLLDCPPDILTEIFKALEGRGLMQGGKVPALAEAPKSDAERKRGQRERDKEKSQCHAEIVTGHETDTESHAKTREREREEENREIPPNPPAGGEEEGEIAFQEFWKARPGRGLAPNSEDKARREFKLLCKTARAKPEALVTAMKVYAAWCRDAQKIGTQYVKPAADFLKDGTWKEYAAHSEVLIEAAQAQGAKLDALPDWQRKLIPSIPQTEVIAWFGGAEFDGEKITFPKKVNRDWVKERYPAQVTQALGKVAFEVRA